MKAEDIYYLILSLGISIILLCGSEVIPMEFTFQVLSIAFGVLLVISGAGLLIRQNNNRKQRATF